MSTVAGALTEMMKSRFVIIDGIMQIINEAVIELDACSEVGRASRETETGKKRAGKCNLCASCEIAGSFITH